MNGRPALRVDDVGIHAVCCGANMWQAKQGSATVFINGKPAHRCNDQTQHCGGTGALIEGSDDVIVGGSASGGGGGGGGGGSNGGAGSGGGSAAGAGGGGAGGAAGSARAGATAGGGGATDAAAGTTTSDAASSQPKQEQATQPDQDDVTFVVTDGVDGQPMPAGVSVLIEFPDGTRQSLDTDGKGRILIRHQKGASFKVVQIGGGHLHATETKQG